MLCCADEHLNGDAATYFETSTLPPGLVVRKRRVFSRNVLINPYVDSTVVKRKYVPPCSYLSASCTSVHASLHAARVAAMTSHCLACRMQSHASYVLDNWITNADKPNYRIRPSGCPC